jgi:hypothetical protein
MLLGIDSVFYLNTNIDGNNVPGWDSPTWSEVDAISDLQENTDWDVADIPIRRSLVKQGAKTMIDVGVSCKLLREPANAEYVILLNALRTRDVVDILVLDGPKDEVGSSGFRYIAQVVKGGGSQNTGDALYRDIVFMPYPDADTDRIPQWADVGAGPVLTFTPITPD